MNFGTLGRPRVMMAKDSAPSAGVRVDLNAATSLGGGFNGPDLTHWTPDTPAFWSLLLFIVLVIAIVAIARSLRA